MSKSSFIENLLLAFANVSLAQERLQVRVSQGLSKKPHRLNPNKREASLGKQGRNVVSDSFLFNRHISNGTAFLKANNVSERQCNSLEGSFKDGLQERKRSLCRDNVILRNDQDWGLQSLFAIPTKELIKIAELRFSGDMQEGDFGEQVALLQRGLFWLGYFPRDLSISGYFGLETKQALQGFQKAHGVPNTGLWGSLSREAFWNFLSTEILHRLDEEKGGAKSGEFAGAWDSPLIGNSRDRLGQIGSQLSQKIKECDVRKFSENVAIAVSTPNWKVTPERGGIILVIGVVFFVLLRLRISMQAKFHGQAVKRRILRSEWYTDRSSRANEGKMNVVHQPDQDSKPLHFSCNSNLAPTMGDQSCGQQKHFIHYGQLLRGSSNAGEERNGDNVIVLKNSIGQPSSKKKVSPAALLVVGQQSSLLDSSTYGIDSHQFRNGIEHGQNIYELSGPEERPWNEQGLIPWIKHVFEKIGLRSFSSISMYQRPKHRTIVRNTTKRRGGKAKRRSHERVNAQRSHIFERASIPASSRGSWQEEDEYNLKKNIDDLRRAVQAAEHNRRAAVEALAEERQRNLELEVKIRRQRKAAAALEEEMRVLKVAFRSSLCSFIKVLTCGKESHDALLDSLRKKYTSSAAARAAAALLYQNWDTNNSKSINIARKIVQDDGAHGISFP